MATQILGGFERDRRSTWGLSLPALLLPSSLPLSPWSPGCIAQRYDLIGLLGTGRRRVGKVGTQGRWREKQDGGGRLSSGLTCGLGAPPWIPPLAARSHCVVQTPPARGEEEENNSMEGREVYREGWRARTIGALPGIMAPRWPTGVQP